MATISAADIMSRDVLTFDPETSVEEAIRTLVDRGFGGAPVVGSDGALLGMISDSDLIVEESRLHVPTVISILGAQITWPPAVHRFQEELRKAVSAKVGDAMNTEPSSVTETASLEDIASVLHDRNIRQVPVLRDGRIVGIVSRRDVLRAMLNR
jgi:CBS domain-containing protein